MAHRQTTKEEKCLYIYNFGKITKLMKDEDATLNKKASFKFLVHPTIDDDKDNKDEQCFKLSMLI